MKAPLYRNLFFIASIISVIACFSCGSSRKVIGLEEGWDLLGQTKVNFIKDKDVIEVAQQNRYTAIRFQVEDKDVRISELKVYMSNGDILQPSLEVEVKAGEKSRLIELGAEGRTISKIEFRYRSLGSLLSGRATVTVVGRRYDQYRRY